MAKWTEEQRLKALSIAAATSAREASVQMGIPRGTITRWMSEFKGEYDDNIPHSPSRKAKKLADEAIEEAKAEVREVVVDQVKQLSQKILEVNIAALDALKDAIEKGPTQDESNAQWVRALGSIMAQGVDRQQLLDGKPTIRSEVNMDGTDEQRQKVLTTIRTGFDDVRKAFGLGSGQDDAGDGSGGTEEVTH